MTADLFTVSLLVAAIATAAGLVHLATFPLVAKTVKHRWIVPVLLLPVVGAVAWFLHASALVAAWRDELDAGAGRQPVFHNDPGAWRAD